VEGVDGRDAAVGVRATGSPEFQPRAWAVAVDPGAPDLLSRLCSGCHFCCVRLALLMLLLLLLTFLFALMFTFLFTFTFTFTFPRP
jgi:hypothetical protein